MRLDRLLVVRKIARSRAVAALLIKANAIRVNGFVINRADFETTETAEISQTETRLAEQQFVSRGAIKLLQALTEFGIDPHGKVAVDLGASTGGFTQVLLQAGAALVFAIEVGHGQMAAELRNDPRLILREGVNARYLTAADFSLETDSRPKSGTETARRLSLELIVADLSFISLTLALPAILQLPLLADGCELVALVKPQFELGKAAIGKGGIVRDTDLAKSALDRTVAWLNAQPNWSVMNTCDSPIHGSDGNQEFLLAARYCKP